MSCFKWPACKISRYFLQLFSSFDPLATCFFLDPKLFYYDTLVDWDINQSEIILNADIKIAWLDFPMKNESQPDINNQAQKAYCFCKLQKLKYFPQTCKFTSIPNGNSKRLSNISGFKNFQEHHKYMVHKASKKY